MRLVRSYLTCLLFLTTSIGWSSVPGPRASDEPPQDISGEVVSMLCPDVSTLTLKNMIWSASGSWKSYNPSFVDKVVGFYGSEWVGARIGTAICLYAGNTANTFPVDIQNSSMFLMPKGGKWKKTGYGRYKCVSTSRYDCPIRLVIPKRNQNSYTDLVHSLKKTS